MTPITQDELNLLRMIRDRESAMVCRVNICSQPPTVVVNCNGLLPFCEAHGEIMAEMEATIALPIDRYGLNDFVTGLIFLGPRDAA